MENHSSPSVSTHVPSWLSIWIKPRETIRRIVTTKPRYQVYLLAALAGLGQFLDSASTRNWGDSLSFPVIIVICVLVGPFGGLLSIYITGALFRWTGSWFGGRATSDEVRAAIAWSLVPNLFSYLLWIPLLVLQGTEIFTSSTTNIESNPILGLLILGILFVQIILSFWTLVLYLICLSEVHKYSIWKTIATLLTGGIILFVPLFILVALMSVITISP